MNSVSLKAFPTQCFKPEEIKVGLYSDIAHFRSCKGSNYCLQFENKKIKRHLKDFK